MASSKARQGKRQAPAKGGRPAARTAAAVLATPTSPGQARADAAAADAAAGERPAERQAAREDRAAPPPSGPPTAPPLWLQLVSLVLAVAGLGISAYETYAHFNGSRLAGCPIGSGTFNCTAVITSPQSMVFGLIPVAVLGVAFYVFAVAITTPWAWRASRPIVHRARLASMVAGVGFVMYLLYVELYQIGQICEYCTAVHIITFLLFCITVVSAALWGLRGAGRGAGQAG